MSLVLHMSSEELIFRRGSVVFYLHMAFSASGVFYQKFYVYFLSTLCRLLPSLHLPKTLQLRRLRLLILT